MDKGRMGLDECDYAGARNGFRAVVKLAPYVDETSKVDVHDQILDASFLLAQMDYEGIGLTQPDYEKARQGFDRVVAMGARSGAAGWFSSFFLAVMDYEGLALETPNYVQARTGFNVVLGKKQYPTLWRSKSFYYRAVMDYEGLGLDKPDYEKARHGFDAALASGMLPIPLRNEALFCLSQMGS